MVLVVELVFIILDQILPLFEPFICGILSRLRVKLETNRDFFVTQVLNLKGQTFDLSLNSFNEEIKSFYDLHKRTPSSRSVLNNNVVDEKSFGFWAKKRSSLLKQAMKLIRSKWPSIKFHLVTFDPIDRQLDWLNYDLCLLEDWDNPNVMPNLSQFVGIYESETNNQAGRQKNPHSKCTREHDIGFGWLDNEKNHKIKCNKWSETRIVYSSPANRKIFLEFMTQEDTEVASKGSSIKSEREKQQQQSAPTATIPAGTSEAEKNLNRSQQQNIVDKSILCIKWATFDEFSLNEARSRLVFYYTQIHPDLPSLYLVLVTILELAGLIEPNSRHLFCTSDLVKKFSNKSSSDDILKSHWWQNSDELDSLNHLMFTNNDSSHQSIDRYTLILMIVAYFNSEEARLRRDNGEACLLAHHLIGFSSLFMGRHDRKSGCDLNDSGRFNEHNNNVSERDTRYKDGGSLDSRCFYVIRPTFEQVGELELVIENRDSFPDYYGVKSKLVVLDPIPRDGNVRPKSSPNIEASRLIGCHSKSRNKSTDIGNDEEKLKCFTNLTKNLETMIEIQRIFAQLRAHLYNIEHISSKKNLKDPENLDFSLGSEANILNCERSSVLQTLFTLSSKKSHFTTSLFESDSRKKSQILTSEGEAPGKGKNSPPSLSQPKATTTLKEILNYGKEPKFRSQNRVEWEETRLPRHFAAEKSLISASKLGELLSSFRWRKILTSFLYFGLFLLARNLLLGYLEGFRSDLRDQARDDMAMQPKQTMFDAKNTGPSSSSNKYSENLHEVDNKLDDLSEDSSGSEIPADYLKIYEAGKRAPEEQRANEEMEEYSKGRQSSGDEARDKLKLDDIDDKLLEELLNTILRQASEELG